MKKNFFLIYPTKLEIHSVYHFPVRKSKIERKIAMKIWDTVKLKASYLIDLSHISNENTAYLFKISRYSETSI